MLATRVKTISSFSFSKQFQFQFWSLNSPRSFPIPALFAYLWHRSFDPLHLRHWSTVSTFFIQLAFTQCPAFNQRRQMYFTPQNTFLHIATRQTSIAAAARRYFSTFLSPFQPSPFTRRFPFLPSSLSSISCPTRGTFVASELYAGWIHPWGGGLGTRVNSALTIRYWLNCHAHAWMRWIIAGTLTEKN